MSTHEVYCSFDICKLLKEAGFDWECNYHYPNDNNLCHGFCNNDPMFKIIIAAPTIEVAQRWLREVKRIFISISSGLREHMVYDCKVVDWRNGYNKNYYVDDTFNTYEEALEVGIKKALGLILKKGE